MRTLKPCLSSLLSWRKVSKPSTDPSEWTFLYACPITVQYLFSEQLLVAKAASQDRLDIHRATLTDLDELGDIMTEMLERQQGVEVCRLPSSVPCSPADENAMVIEREH